MRHERQTGLAFSVALHLLLLLLLIFGLPSILKNEPPIEPAAITVELLPITGITNVKPVDGTITEKQKPEEPKPEPEQKKPAPPVKTAQPAPTSPPAPEPKPKDAEKIPDPTKVEKKPEKPKEEPKKEEEKEKPKKAKEEDLKAILDAVKETATKEKTDKKPETKETAPTNKAVSNQYDASLPMSLSEKDAIMSQLAKCWSPNAGGKDAQNMIVIISAEFNVDGSLIKAEISADSKGRYNSDLAFKDAADRALRAVRQCSPLQNLPQDKYGTWKSMELHFDPRDMLL